MRKIKSAPANLCLMVHKKKKELTKTMQNTLALPNNTSFEVKNKKRISRIIIMSLSDGFSQISKLNPILDEHFEFNSIIESSLEFANSRMTKENFEYLIYSLIVRFIISNIYHDIVNIIEKISIN